ncbi:Crp/Fnr family transcriptional regulator [Streptomyces echinatus]|uniref:Crp/Fnr family transcriptional regulator n=1 Tax=Streptomyces echinatus TaxID=67293 RepID=UPI00378BD612
MGTPRAFQAEEILAREGEDHASFWLILGGWVRLTAIADNGTVAFLHLQGPGDLIGELDGRLNTSTATAAQRVSARRIHRSVLLQFLQQHPDATLSLAEAMVDMLRQANRRRLDTVAYPATVRIARILVELAETYGTEGQEIRPPLSQRDLASLAGVTLPTVEKALRLLRETGVVARGYRSVSINNMPALHDLAGYWSD